MNRLADEKKSVAALYEDQSVAGSYLEKRMQFSWQRLLHQRQVAIMNDVVRKYSPKSILELAPGPARISAELVGVSNGVMIENSEGMLQIARRRLADRGLEKVWTVIGGSAFDLEKLTPGREFDLTYTFRFLRHFRDAERAEMYRAIRNRLEANGVLVFDVVNKRVRDVLDAAQPEKPAGELPVYDITYTPESFEAEMKASGFRVEALHPLIHHFNWQSWLSYKGDDIARPFVQSVVRALEMLPSKTPLEWVAVCRKS